MSKCFRTGGGCSKFIAEGGVGMTKHNPVYYCFIKQVYKNRLLGFAHNFNGQDMILATYEELMDLLVDVYVDAYAEGFDDARNR